MVSIREIRRMWKGKRGLTDDAVIEFQMRAEQLIESLLNLSNYEATSRGNTSSRLLVSDVRLAYFAMMDNRSDEKDEIEEDVLIRNYTLGFTHALWGEKIVED